MARSDNSKARQAALWQIFQRHSDDAHGLTMAEILSYLERDYDIETTRQSVASDFLMLDTVLHITIEADNSVRPARYYWTNRAFTAQDVAQLAESVQTNPALTNAERKATTEKLKTLCSEAAARRITIKNEVAAQARRLSESDLEMLSTLREAIKKQEPVSIRYQSFRFAKDAHPAPEITEHWIYPLEVLSLEDRPAVLAQTVQRWNYKNEPISEPPAFRLFYIEYISGVHSLKNTVAEREPRPDEDTALENIAENPARLFSGKTKRITLQCTQKIMPLVYERFGAGITVDKVTEDSCRAAVETVISPALFGWLFSLGDAVKLLTPLHAAQRMKQWLQAVSSSYGL